MRIAIDAKWYHQGPAGVHTYISNLVDTLQRLDARNSYRVFLRSGDRVPEHLTGERWRAERLWPNLSAPRVWWALPRAVRGEGVDLFFTQSLTPRTHRAPRAVTVHDVLWHDFPEHFTWRERLHFGLIDRDIRRADLIITDSEHSRARICETSGRRESDVAVAPLGVSPRFRPLADAQERESLRTRLGLPEEFALYVGRLNRRKNLPNLFRALAKASENLPLVCAGRRDWRQDDLERLLGSLGLRDRVIFLGHVADDDLPGLYSLATVFAYVPFAEGFGIPPLEAMACGTPVLTSDTTSLPEVVGDAGLCVSPHSVDAIAEGLASLVGDSALRRDLAARGLGRAAQFTWESTAQKTLALWERLA